MPEPMKREEFMKKNAHQFMDKPAKNRLFDTLLEHNKKILVDQLLEHERRGTWRAFPLKKLSEKTRLSEEKIDFILTKDPERTREQRAQVEEHLEVLGSLHSYDPVALKNTTLKEWSSWPQMRREVIQTIAEKVAEKVSAEKGGKFALHVLENFKKMERKARNMESLFNAGINWLNIPDEELLKKTPSQIHLDVMLRVKPDKSEKIFGRELNREQVDDLKAKLIDSLQERRKELLEPVDVPRAISRAVMRERRKELKKSR